ncbi:MAG: HAMP domain-containing sensor histidine kinase [Lachnospiraceae bacterium]|nr:HAMP domain-containing sensor histidine kinase [Lachnospiraceae bacterium]
MKLNKRVFLALLVFTFAPVVMTIAALTGGVFFEAGNISEEYGIDVMESIPFGNHRGVIIFIIILMLAVVVVTGIMLSRWMYRSVAQPITSLTGAARSIRDGKLDFELTPEGNVTEIRDLYTSFEQMRTNLRAAREESREIDRQNRELISNISHDLRTPLTAVQGYCEGIIDGVADSPEKMERYVRTIYNKTVDMSRLINELSFYSQITTNRIPYLFDKVSAGEFFDDAAEEIGDEIRSKGGVFVYRNELPPDTSFIVDAERLKRVLHNIISNSIKYTDKPEKRIVMEVNVKDGEVIASVTDNGKGISEKDLPNVFDRFFRADTSRHPEAGGSGIGLSIVKKIIEDHGGRVWALSTEGSGTTISFALAKYDGA